MGTDIRQLLNRDDYNAIIGANAPGAGNVFATMNDISAITLDDLSDVTVPTPNSGDNLVWSGTEWIASPAQTAVGSANKFYLDATNILADNLTLSVAPSSYAEIINSKTVLIATSPVFFERFISNPLGVTSIPAGTWQFDIYAATENNSGTNEIKLRVNKRVIQLGMTATYTGAGATRTLTVSGGTPFLAGMANADRLLAGLTETGGGTPQTSWISAFISTSVVTVTLTDPAFVNVAGVPFDAIYEFLFQDTTEDITGSTPTLYSTLSVQPEFTGLTETDRLVVAFFGNTTDDSGNDTMYLYYGGTEHFTHIITPLITKHNDLSNLQGGSNTERYHLTSSEKTGVVSDSIGVNINGNGNIIQVGNYGGYIRVPFSGLITGWSLYEGSSTPLSSTCVLDVWKKATFYPTVAETIFGTKPALSATTNNSATGLSIAVTAGDIITYNVDSNNNAKILNLQLKITKN